MTKKTAVKKDPEVNPLLERMLRAYINIRDTRSKLKREFESTDNEMKKQADLLETQFLKMMQDSGSDNLTVRGLGQVIKSKKEQAQARDWNSIIEYIQESGDVEILQRRLALGRVKQYLDDNAGALPPGVDLTTEITVTVRRA